MNRQTRKLCLNLVTGLAVAMAAAFVFLPAAQAAPGVVTANVNVRSGPSTSYGVVDVAKSGTRVEVRRCDGSFCYIEKAGPDGWVSASYLSAAGRPVNPSNPGLSFGFTIGGSGGPNISIGIGNSNQPIVRPRPPRDPIVRPRPAAEVCFFEHSRFRGDRDCYRSGQSVSNLGRRGDGFQSIRNESGLRVEVCTQRNFRNCRIYTTSASSLGRLGNDIASFRIR